MPTSNIRPVNIGVPQGSILGPLSFHVHVNNLLNSTTTSPHLFADDTCLVISCPSMPSLTQTCNNKFHNLILWCDANYLQVNSPQPVSLTIPFKQNEPAHEMQLFYNECVIANKELCKYLAVIIDSKT